MIKVSWVERITNEEILNRVQEERSIWNIIKKRRDRMIGHILRHGGLIQMIIERMVQGKRSKGSPRHTYVEQIVGDVGVTSY